MAPDITTNTAITKTTALSKAPSQPRRAYVTFVAGNGDRVNGVVGLAKSLRRAESKYPLVVAMLPDVPIEHRNILLDQGCILRDIKPLDPPENWTQFAAADYVRNYSKLRIFEFEEYRKMIYLDKHIQVFENIDHLFDMPDGHFYAVMDCFCEKPAPYFNAGMFVYEPSISTYHDLLNTLKITPPTPFAEQDFLNVFFKDIYKPISPFYNLVPAMLWRHPEKIELDKARVVHYCSAPGRYTGNEQNMEREDMKMLVQKCLDIYNDESLDCKDCSSPAAATEAEAEAEGEVVAEPDEDVIPQPSLDALWEAAGCCSIEDLCLQPFLSAVSEAFCFSTENLSLEPFLEALWEATGCCSIKDLCLPRFLASVSDAGCFSTEELSLQPFLETLWGVGAGVIEELTSFAELYMGGYRCGGFVFWF